MQRSLRHSGHSKRNGHNGTLRAAAILGAMALLISAGGCGASASGSDTKGMRKVSFMLDWTPNTNHIGLYAAQQLGYFRQAGIDADILPTAQAGAETSVENGIADIGFTTLSNVAAFDAKGADLKFVFDLTQKPIARWCALASRKDIVTPKDLSGKTFVSFGSAEQNAVVAQMIKHAGGTGKFSTATAGTNTFATLTSGKGDFGGFYANWEEVESKLYGPALHCFVASDWGVPGNPDQLGYAVKASWLANATHRATLRVFLAAARKGYDYALTHPNEASDMLIKQNPTAQLKSRLVRASMATIIANHYWTTTDPKHITATTNIGAAQPYLDFQYKAGTYLDNAGHNPNTAPQATQLSTNEYLR